MGLVLPDGQTTGHLILGRDRWPCALGKGGIRADKAEGVAAFAAKRKPAFKHR